MTERSFYILAYDIGDNKRRNKIAKLMESLGERVQGSVFEAYLAPDELEKIYKRSQKVMNDKEDSLRVYSLCLACRGRITVKGEGRVTPPPSLVVV
jgi:CRISPR-associated protein Cas2